jgi:hypothetical protein
MRAKQSGAHKVRRIINLVGEEIAAQEEAGSAALECMEILKPIDERRIHSCIYVKPKRLCQAIDKASSEHTIDVVEESVAKHVSLTPTLVMSILK